MKTFIGTSISYNDLTKWILAKFKRYRITDLRYFGSRVHGKTVPRKDSDIDVYLLFDGKHPNRMPIFSEIFKHENKNFIVECHMFDDFHDDWIPSHLIIEGTKNQIV